MENHGIDLSAGLSGAARSALTQIPTDYVGFNDVLFHLVGGGVSGELPILPTLRTREVVINQAY